MGKFVRENSLSLVLFGLFAFSVAGQYFVGWQEYNEEQIQHGQAAVDAASYLATGHFWEAIFENWESEFLQMAAFVVLTVFLFQKGSAESREGGGKIERSDVIQSPEHFTKDTPWPLRKGGIYRKIYENSLGLTLFLLFVGSFVMHGVSGAADYNEQQTEHGGNQVTAIEYMGTSRFWFESLQNWQSEFLSVGMMIVLTIFLRQKGSPESKPVDSPWFETG